MTSPDSSPRKGRLTPERAFAGRAKQCFAHASPSPITTAARVAVLRREEA